MARFNDEQAKRAVRFFEGVLVHTKGRWSRVPFRLANWQRDQIIRPLFGQQRFDRQTRTWVRQYRMAWLEMARKNGKSELLAGIALYLLCMDDEEGAEVFGAASDRDQAALVFDVAKRMVELSPMLQTRLKVIDSRRRIVDPRTSSVYQVIAADHLGNLGQNPSGIVFDEAIAQPDARLWDALRTGMGTRSQPLMVAATTAGSAESRWAKAEHDYSLRVAAQPELDPSRLVFMRNTPPEAEPWDEANWAHANPALGDFLSVEQLRAEAKEARADPRKENAFRQYRLNQWVQAVTRWLSLERWDELAGPTPDLTGRACYGGLDLAATTDLAALAWLFPGAEGEPADILVRFWTPERMIETLDRHTGALFSQWTRDGWVTVIEGDAIDYDIIHRQLIEDGKRFDVRDIGVDRWNSQATINFMAANQLPATALSQGYALSGAMQELEKLVKAAAIRHDNNPVLRWNVNSAEVKRGLDERIRLVKPFRGASGVRVDGIAALTMAIDRQIGHATEPKPPEFAFYSLG